MSQFLTSSEISQVNLHQLQQENVELQRRFAAQQRVLHSMENRIAQSLETLQIHLDQIKAIKETEDFGVYLNSIGTETQGLCDLLADAMTLQKLEAGKVPVHLEVLDPQSILTAVTRHLLIPHHEAASRLICKIAPDLPLIYADQDLLQAVLTDLLMRGLKYSEPKLSVTLEAFQCSEQLHLNVTAQRFAPQGEREFATEIALCCKRIEVQGGEVTCHLSSAGLTLVTVALPLLIHTAELKAGQMDATLVGTLN